jgi:hypothetical protein
LKRPRLARELAAVLAVKLALLALLVSQLRAPEPVRRVEGAPVHRHLLGAQGDDHAR